MKQTLIFWSITLVLFMALAIPIAFGAEATGISNPIAAKNLQCLVLQLFRLLINVLAFVCVGYFIWVGFLFVQAQGSSEGIKKAKTTLVNVLIGTVLVMGAWAFAEIISRTINSVAGKGKTSSLSTTTC